MAYSGSLEKMVITAYSDGKFASQAGPPFSVYINPDKYKHDYKIVYNCTQAQGSNGGSPRFNRMPSETISFELVFDGTGVVPSPLPGFQPFTDDGITRQIEAFKSLVFTYNGKIHSPNFLKVAWGTLLFKCRLASLGVDYTLFKPDGTPLRARAQVSLTEYTDPKELAKEATKSSPDMSHLVTVKAGDTLPLLCFRIYGSSIYYPQVAKANGLSCFRYLTPGSRLLFPPLDTRGLA